MILPFDSLIAERYQVKELLGRGALSEVYAVHDLAENNLKALKLLISHLLPGNYSIPSLMNQIEASFNMNHPNIVPVNEIGSTQEGIFITMPLIRGKNLKNWIEKTELSHQKALRAMISLIEDIGGAIDYAHSRGIIHRDIKPSNIMIDKKEKFHLLDFGAAIFRDHGLSQHETLYLGTPPYYPPRKFLDQNKIDTRIDVYSFAYIICELIECHFEQSTYLSPLLKECIAGAKLIVNDAMEPVKGKKYASIKVFCKDLSDTLTAAHAEYEPYHTKNP